MSRIPDIDKFDCDSLTDKICYYLSLLPSGTSEISFHNYDIINEEILEFLPSTITSINFNNRIGLISYIRCLFRASRLSFDHCDIDDQFLLQLSNSKKLTSLSLEETNITGLGLDHISKSKTLRYLKLFHNRYLSNSDIEYLSSSKTLSHLELFGSLSFSRESLHHLLSESKSITYLSMRSCYITDDVIIAISESKTLTHLTITSRSGVADIIINSKECLEHLTESKSLIHLEFHLESRYEPSHEAYRTCQYLLKSKSLRNGRITISLNSRIENNNHRKYKFKSKRFKQIIKRKFFS
jgi:hypothetical protein